MKRGLVRRWVGLRTRSHYTASSLLKTGTLRRIQAVDTVKT